VSEARSIYFLTDTLVKSRDIKKYRALYQAVSSMPNARPASSVDEAQLIVVEATTMSQRFRRQLTDIALGGAEILALIERNRACSRQSHEAAAHMGAFLSTLMNVRVAYHGCSAEGTYDEAAGLIADFTQPKESEPPGSVIIDEPDLLLETMDLSA